MTTSRHTALPFGGPLTSAAMESPLSQLDTAIVAAEGALTAEAAARSAAVSAGDTALGARLDAIIIDSGTSDAETIDARGGYATLGTRVRATFNVMDYNPLPGAVDNHAALQACLTAAFNAPGGTMVVPVRDWLSSAPLVTPADTAGSVTIRGEGRPGRSFTGGMNGDPFAAQGATITYTGNTGDVFLADVSGGFVRQYITLENMTIQGNVAGGASGHGLHFKSSSAASAVFVNLRDVFVNGAKQTGILFDGLILESQLFNVRSNQNGDRGFKAAPIGPAIPGEVRIFGSTFNQNLVGVDIAGGHFSYHGLTATLNTNEGLIATACSLEGIDLQLETNGTAAGNQGTLTSLFGATLIGVNISARPAGTGKGLSFVSCTWCHVQRFGSDSSTTGAGYKDIDFADTSSRCTVENYAADDFVDRIGLGAGGGHAVRRGGGDWLTGQYHAQETLSSAVDGTQTFDMDRHDSFLSIRTVAGKTIAIGYPTISVAFHVQRATFHVFNNTAGATTTTWHGVFHLAGAWVDPAAGKTRTIVFELDPARGFFEIARSAADIT